MRITNIQKMGLIFLAALSLLVVYYFFFKNSSSTYHLIIQCNVVDVDGRIVRNVPGYICDFYKNGDYLSVRTEKGISYFNRNNELVWTRDDKVHHKLTISNDEQRISYLSSVYSPQSDGKRIRWDQMMVLDRTGKILAQNTTYALLEELRKYHDLSNELQEVDWVKSNKITLEYTHANTFFEIPSNSLESRFPWLKKGNYMVNLHRLREMVIFLDPTLKKILHVIQLNVMFGGPVKTHDLQILSNGNLLIYVNRMLTGDAEQQDSSRLIEYSLAENKIVWQYFTNPKTSFMSPIHGGIEIVGEDSILFSDETNGEGWVKWINRQGILQKQWPVPFKDPKTGKPSEFQEAIAKDLSDFLKNHNPL